MNISQLEERFIHVEAVDELEAHLQCQLTGRIHNLRLVVRDNGLVLQGQATTYYAKQVAQHTLMEATSLPLLANEIEVL